MKKFYSLAVSCCGKLFLIFFLLLSFISKAQESMRANLYALNTSGTILLDGNLTEYNIIYSNTVDINDAWKMVNPGVNFGIERSGYDLAVERRSALKNYDTTFFRMWNMSKSNYNIKFILKDLDQKGMYAFIKDNYFGTKTAVDLNDTTDFMFTINNDLASAAEMRFQLIYALDVDFKDFSVQRKGADVRVQWQAANELAIESYWIEQSADGINFNNIRQVIPYYNNAATNSYDYIHAGVSAVDIFYRIKAVGSAGRVLYSAVEKATENTSAPGISVYPNPVVNKTVQLQFNNLAAGKYNTLLLYSNGMQQQLSPFQLGEWQTNGSVNLPQSLPPGTYQLRFTGPGNKRIIKNILIF